MYRVVLRIHENKQLTCHGYYRCHCCFLVVTLFPSPVQMYHLWWDTTDRENDPQDGWLLPPQRIYTLHTGLRRLSKKNKFESSLIIVMLSTCWNDNFLERWGLIKVTAKFIAIPQKVKHRITIRPGNSTPRYLPKIMESGESNRYLYTNVHCSVIHGNQKVETSVHQQKNG